MLFPFTPIIAIFSGACSPLTADIVSKCLGTSSPVPTDEANDMTPSDIFFLSHERATEEEWAKGIQSFYTLMEKTAAGEKILFRCQSTGGASHNKGPRPHRKFYIDGTPAGILKVYLPPHNA